MARADPAGSFDHYLTRNQQRFRIRALRPGEAAPLHALWPHLSPKTRYLRFLSIINSPTLPDALTPWLMSAENATREAFIAEELAGAGAEVLGLANLGKLDAAAVEVGLVVRDDWQRQQVGTALATKMMLVAESRGVNRFIGHVLEENVAMRNMLRKIGDVVSTKVSGSVHEMAFVRRQLSEAGGRGSEAGHGL